MTLNELAKQYNANATIIKQYEIDQKLLGSKIMNEFKIIGTVSLTLPSIGTFSVVEKKTWNWGNEVKVANEIMKQAKEKEKASREADKIAEYLRFQAEPTERK